MKKSASNSSPIPISVSVCIQIILIRIRGVLDSAGFCVCGRHHRTILMAQLKDLLELAACRIESRGNHQSSIIDHRLPSGLRRVDPTANAQLIGPRSTRFLERAPHPSVCVTRNSPLCSFGKSLEGVGVASRSQVARA